MSKPKGYDQSPDYGIHPNNYTWKDWARISFIGLTITLIPLLLFLNANAKQAYPAIASIYWSDGDSGRINGTLKFRLANIDAPETRSMKQSGGAKCEAERKLGFDAKAYIISITTGQLRIEHDYGKDRYGRLVIDLSTDGNDVGKMGVKAEHLRGWPHKNGRKLSDKPDWCY